MMYNSIGRMRRSFRVLVSPLQSLFIAGLCLLIGFRLFAIEPFDFDEALYRRIAEEMKALGHWSPQPLFNGESYNLTPPIFVGALAFVSWILDGTEPQISSFSVRFFGLLCTALSVFFIHRTWVVLSRRKEVFLFEHRREIRTGISPIYFLLMCFLPTLAALAVVPEILFSFFTTLFVCVEAVRIHTRFESRRSSFLLFLISVGALFGATVTSGLSGMILSSASALFFCLWSGDSSKQRLRQLGFFVPQILLAVFFFFLFLEWLRANGGKNFVEGFVGQMLIEQASAPAWSDSWVHYWSFPTMLISSSLLLSWLSVSWQASCPVLEQTIEQPREHIQVDKTLQHTGTLRDVHKRLDGLTSVRRWLLSWSAACCLYFVFSTSWRQSVGWSLCPILALLASMGFSESSCSILGVRARFFLSWSSRVLPFVLPTLFFLFGLVIICWEPVFGHWVTLNFRQAALVSSFLDQKVPLLAGFFAASACLFSAAFLLRVWRSRCWSRGYISQIFSLGIARWLAFFQTAAVTIVVLLVAPVAEEVVSATVQQSTAKARMFLGVGAKLATADLYSPTVVSSQREKVIMDEAASESIFMDSKISVVLTPVWNLEVCRKYGFDIAQGVEYLRVCLRSYKQTLEGRPP